MPAEDGTRNMNIFASLLQGGQTPKTPSGSAQEPSQAGVTSSSFGEMVEDATKAASVPADDSVAVLKQKIQDLVVNTENQMIEASEQNVLPESAEEILTQAMDQLWMLLETFDFENGTTLVSDLSENLLQDASGIDQALLATTLAQPMIQLVSDLFALQLGKPAMNAGPQNRFLQESGLLAGSDLVAKNAQLQDSAGFARLTQMIEPQTLQQKPSILTAAQLASQVSSQGEKAVVQVAPALPQNMQQIAAIAPLKEQTPKGSLPVEPAANLVNAIKKSNAVVTTFVAGIDVNAKAKELLVQSAKAIAAGKDIVVTSGENSGPLQPSRSDLLANSSLPKPEQTAQANSFSKNIASQINGETLRVGRTRIELAPRGLGSIVIDLQVKEAGGLQVMLRAENPAVLHALRNDRDALLGVLANGDVSKEDISLDFEGFGQGEFRQDEEDEIMQLTTNQNQEDPENNDEPAMATKGSIGSGQLDFFT